MYRAWLAAQIIGFLFCITGLYLIGVPAGIIIGILFIMFGYGVAQGVKKDGAPKPDISDKSWEQ